MRRPRLPGAKDTARGAPAALESPPFGIKGSSCASPCMLLRCSGAQTFGLLPLSFAICIVDYVPVSLSVEPAAGRRWETMTLLEPG